MDLPHYLPKAERHPISDLLAELVEECVQYLSIMTEAEVDRLVDGLPPGLKMLIDHKASVGRDKVLLERIALYYLVAVVYTRQYIPLKQIVAGDISKSEVLVAYPELRGKMDK
ncbi:MAG TPA: hypothetical protein VMY98_08435, partial [Anaerolineae bacterium]|nr:hypothetical protein [Anaerolineae bacterium]